jgi:hypothetical protein
VDPIHPPSRRHVPSYLIEVYVSRSGDDDVHSSIQRARAAATELAREGAAIRYLRTTFLPDDETCFHLVEAASIEVVEAAVARAALGRARVTAAVES